MDKRAGFVDDLSRLMSEHTALKKNTFQDLFIYS